MRIRRSLARGFTLVDFLVGLAVLGVTAALAIPSYDRIVSRSRLAVSVNELLSALLTARMTAVARNVSTTFCAGNRVVGCHRDWTKGEWIVFADRDRNGQLDAGDTLYGAERMASAGAVMLGGNGPFASAVVFRPSGAATWTSGAFAAGRLRVCVNTAISPNATDLVLIGSGRAVSEAHDYSGSCPMP